LALVPLDYVEFFVFLAVLCLVGFFSGRGERKSSTDYFLAGRRLPWYAVGGSYVAANVSTEHFIGLVGATYILGMPTALAQWVTTLAEVVIVMLFVPFLIRANVVTVPQYLAARFGSAVRLAFALLTIFANITIFMAAVMYAGGLALSGFFGWPLLWCIIGTGAFAGVWAIYGGLNTVAWTGVFTAIVKIGGVQAKVRAVAGEREALVDRAVGRRELDRRGRSAVPRRDAAILGRPQEAGGRSGPAEQKIVGRRIGRDAGRHALAGAARRRDDHRRRRRNRHAKPVVQRRGAGPVVRHPDGACRTHRDAPAIHEVGIGMRRHAGQIGDEIRDGVAAGVCESGCCQRERAGKNRELPENARDGRRCDHERLLPGTVTTQAR